MAENGQLTEDEARQLRGVHPNALPIPPGLLGQTNGASPSEGTMSKFSYRRDPDNEGFFTRAVANPDGTPIAEQSEKYLAQLIELYVAPFIDPNVATHLAVIKSLLSGESRLILASKNLAAAGDYAANDALSASTSAGDFWVFRDCAREPGRGFMVMGARMLCSTEGVLFRPRLHMMVKAPGEGSPADNAAFSVTEGLEGSYLGALDLPAFADIGTMAGTWDFDIRMEFPTDPDSKDAFGILQTLDAEAGEAAGMALGIALIVRQL